MLRGLIRAGMDVARVNFSHGDPATHRQSIATLRRVAKEEGRLVAVVADLQGPKLRVGDIEGGGIDLRQGDAVILSSHAGEGPGPVIPVPHPDLFDHLRAGHSVLLDDGRLELTVTEAEQDRVKCEVVTGGQLLSRKGINVPMTDLGFSSLMPKDRVDVRFAVEQGVDYVALSFVRRPEDVRELRRLLDDLGADVAVIPKIEKREALSMFDEILTEADGIMVARGDLGVETPAEEVPFHQKRIIRACNQAGKPVITATQMLQTMIEHPRPTRAEASDVVNAILDGTDAVMLSGETAVGRYPMEATTTMASICANAEAHLSDTRVSYGGLRRPGTVTGAISYAAVEIADEVEAAAIVTATMSGTTARMVARHRPPVPVVAVTPNQTSLRRLALVWGVSPVPVPNFETTDQMAAAMVRAVADRGLVSKGDVVVLTAGVPFGMGRKTNMLRVHVVGERGWL
jgi:pyruvate kinase